jgi:1,4-dihydroxy-2-naphthoate octaprenyltransferase
VAASVPIGITTSLILFCSHFHQVEDDRAAGKTSPIVRLGTSVGSRVLSGVTGLVYVPIALGIAGKVYPVGTGLIFASLPFAWRLVNHVRENHARPDRVSNSKFLAVNLHFFSGIFLASGYLF